MKKTLRKAIMFRSRLKISVIKTDHLKTGITAKDKETFCKPFFEILKKNYFGNLNLKNTSDNRKFWKTIKLCFSKKELNSNKYLLLGKEVLKINKRKIAKKFNERFINVASRSKLSHCPNSSNKSKTLDKLTENLNFILVFGK